MSGNIKTKRCFACGEVKPTSDFQKDRSRGDGLQPRCRACKAKLWKDIKSDPIKHIEYCDKRNLRRMYRRKNEEGYHETEKRKSLINFKKSDSGGKHRKRYPDKIRARRIALSIPIQPCEICGTTEEVERHHDDYNKPEEVRFLCHYHHTKYHVKLRREEELKSA